MKRALLTYTVLLLLTSLSYAQIYSTNLGSVKFLSNAPLELIKAESDQLKGALNIKNKTFAFKIFIKSFDGFNSPLQKEHFYENYLEVRSFPESIFKGKLLEDIDTDIAKSYRAKGVISIHGISKEIIIDVLIEPTETGLAFSSKFNIDLKDYKIQLPRIVYQKIAETINVEVAGELTLKE